MKNYVQHGGTLDVVAPSGGVVSGTAYLIGATFGVATTTAAVGEIFALRLTGVFTLPKTTAQAWTQLVALYWDDTAKKLTTTASGNTKVGVAAAAADAAAALGNVRLNGAF